MTKDNALQFYHTVNGLTVQELHPQDSTEWDDFIQCFPSSVPTQLSAWKQIMTAVYGHRCYYLMARQGGEVKGVLPLIEVNSLIMGRSLQSMPGGMYADSPASALALITAAEQLAMETKADYFLLRDSRQAWPEATLETIEAHRGVRINLAPDSQMAWKALPKDERYHIRHGQKQAEIHIVFDPCKLDDFFTVFLACAHQMGTPLFSQNFVREVQHTLGNHCLIVIAYLENKPISAFFNFTFDRRLYGMWGGSLPTYRNLNVTHQMYWAMIETAVRMGLSVLDMGRSSYPSGQYTFKAQWGNETYPIYQLYRAFHRKRNSMVKASLISESTSGYNIFRRLWKHLPLQIAQILGPQLRWHLPFG